jgi:peptidoglycan/LPS O-acetylase OafA/YrhL
VSASPGTPAADRLVVGDPLRGVAALAVILVHIEASLPVAAGYGSAPGATQAILTPLGMGVSRIFPASILLLFALSGYLITRPFTHALVEGSPLPPLRRYLRNRILRIVPLFWAAVAALLVAEWVFGWVSVFAPPGATTSPLDALALFGFMQDATPHSPIAEAQLGPGWTLHVELVFYLLIPLFAVVMARALRSRAAPGTRIVALVALALLVGFASLGTLAAVKPDVFDLHPYHWFVTNAYAFMPGVMLACIEPLVAPWLAARTRLRALAPVLAAASVGLLAAYSVVTNEGHVATAQGIGTLAVGVGLSACIVKQWSGAGAWRVLDNRVMHWVGERSYSIYVLHGTVIAIVYRFVGGSPRVALLELALLTYAGTLALAALTFRYIEQPFLGRRRHVAVEPGVSRVAA